MLLRSRETSHEQDISLLSRSQLHVDGSFAIVASCVYVSAHDSYSAAI